VCAKVLTMPHKQTQKMAARPVITTYREFEAEVQRFLNDPSSPREAKAVVMGIDAEISQVNFNRCYEMFTLLRDINPEQDLPADTRARIIALGQEISNAGGRQAMQGCYNCMHEMLATTREQRRNVKIVQSVWDGIGQWVA
jgi:hypothetical protein